MGMMNPKKKRRKYCLTDCETETIKIQQKKKQIPGR